MLCGSDRYQRSVFLPTLVLTTSNTQMNLDCGRGKSWLGEHTYRSLGDAQMLQNANDVTKMRSHASLANCRLWIGCDPWPITVGGLRLLEIEIRSIE